jgi:hypothetical protein
VGAKTTPGGLVVQTTTTPETTPEEANTAMLGMVLRAASITAESAANVINLLPPAGRLAMLVAIHSGPLGFRNLTTGFIGDVADLLRVTYADAALIRSELRTAVNA